MKKGIFTVLMAAVLSMAAALSAYAGEWVTTDEGYLYKYKNDDGSFVGEGVVEIDGKKCLFGSDGTLLAEECYLDENYFQLSDFVFEVMRDWIDHCFVNGVDSETSSLIQQVGFDKVEPQLHSYKNGAELKKVTYGDFHFLMDTSNMTAASILAYTSAAIARIGQLYPREHWSISNPRFGNNELIITLNELSEENLSFEEAGWTLGADGYWRYSSFGSFG